MYNDVTGIILCGGKSSRMGVNKALLKLSGSNTIEIISKLMRELFKRVMLITNEPGLYEFLKLESFEDIYKEKGPLGGIHSGLKHSDTDKNFVISCDIPLISREAIKFITDYPSEKSIKVPFADGHIQQLCGVYSKACLPAVEGILIVKDNHKKCNVLKLIERTGAEIINIGIEMQGCAPDTFFNMNSMTDYKCVERIYEARLV